ncbi:hypothetical protein PMIN04_009229 [Paraphaeosphaeria minitans]
MPTPNAVPYENTSNPLPRPLEHRLHTVSPPLAFPSSPASSSPPGNGDGTAFFRVPRQRTPHLLRPLCMVRAWPCKGRIAAESGAPSKSVSPSSWLSIPAIAATFCVILASIKIGLEGRAG